MIDTVIRSQPKALRIEMNKFRRMTGFMEITAAFFKWNSVGRMHKLNMADDLLTTLLGILGKMRFQDLKILRYIQI